MIHAGTLFYLVYIFKIKLVCLTFCAVTRSDHIFTEEGKEGQF